jgi:hypothetical protein
MLPGMSIPGAELSLRETTSAVKAARLSTLARWSLFWAAFIGLGALLGVGMMWTAPQRVGMIQLLEPMRRLPFGDVLARGFGWPGLALLLVIGVPHLIAAGLIWRRHRLAPWAVLVAGLVLVAWLALQLFFLYGPNPVTNMYLLFALLEILFAVLWRRAERANH